MQAQLALRATEGRGRRGLPSPSGDDVKLAMDWPFGEQVRDGEIISY